MVYDRSIENLLYGRHVVEQIERAREYRGISVAELARRIGVDRKRLWRVLNGQREMRVGEFLKLCVFFDMGLDRFVTQEDVKRIRSRHKN